MFKTKFDEWMFLMEKGDGELIVVTLFTALMLWNDQYKEAAAHASAATDRDAAYHRSLVDIWTLALLANEAVWRALFTSPLPTDLSAGDLERIMQVSCFNQLKTLVQKEALTSGDLSLALWPLYTNTIDQYALLDEVLDHFITTSLGASKSEVEKEGKNRMRSAARRLLLSLFSQA